MKTEHTCTSKTIVFIHGFMNNSKCWEQWIPFFEKKGFNCFAPSWPFHEGNIKELRYNPSLKLKNITLQNVLDYYEEFISKLDEKPILIGHSLGGIIVQKLISNDKAVAGACVCSGPPKGIFSFDLNFIVSNLALINPFKGNSPCLMSAKWYHKYVCNEMSYSATKAFIEHNCIADSRNIPRSISKYGDIDFNKPHVPILFIAGSADKSQPTAIIRKNFKAYKDPKSKRSFSEFQHRTHNILNQNGWKEVASYIYEWLDDTL